MRGYLRLWLAKRGSKLMESKIRACMIASALAGVCGCADSTGAAPRVTVYEVKGQVLLADGRPLSGGHVYFVSKEGAMSSEGTLGADGTFSLSTGRSGEGAPPGDYKVRIEPADTSILPGRVVSKRGNALPFPAKYLDEDSSQLIAKVEPKANKLEPFRLR
jgi:hypothetical protein